MKTIHIIGGGLAGSEAAWQAAQAGNSVVLHEMRPRRMTEAHTGEGLAELVCSNSFRSDDRDTNAVGLLYRISRVIAAHGCDVDLVLIATEGEKAIDVFHITKGGSKLTEAEQQGLTSDLLRILEDTQ